MISSVCCGVLFSCVPERISSYSVAPGSVRLSYGLGVERFEQLRFSVPAVSLGKWFFGFSLQFKRKKGTVPVAVSVPGTRFQPFLFRFWFLESRLRRFWFPVPIRFLGHPVRRQWAPHPGSSRKPPSTRKTRAHLLI